MQNSSTRKHESRTRPKQRSLKRRKPKSSNVWTAKNDPLDLENPDSQLAKTNIRNILTDQVFKTLPLECQSKLAELLPVCDRRSRTDSSFSAGPEALSNEFFAKACLEWADRLADGDFTQDTQIRCKLEREKRLHVDPWKKKYFESFWGEKRISAAMADAAAFAPVASSEASTKEKCQVLPLDIRPKTKSTPRTTSTANKSNWQAKEQLSQMLCSKSARKNVDNGKVNAAPKPCSKSARKKTAEITIDATYLLDSNTVKKNVDDEKVSAVIAASKFNSCMSASSQSADKASTNSAISSRLQSACLATTSTSVVGRPSLTHTSLGKRLMSTSESTNDCPSKRPLFVRAGEQAKLADGSDAATPGCSAKLLSIGSRMPVLASALQRDDSRRIDSISSSIPAALLAENPAEQTQSPSLSRIITLNSLLRSDCYTGNLQRKETDTGSSTSCKSMTSVRDELICKLQNQSNANAVKKKLFSSKGSCSSHPGNSDSIAENVKGVFSQIESDGRPTATLGHQIMLPSSLLQNQAISTSILNTLVVSNAPFAVPTSALTNIGGFKPTHPVGHDKINSSSACDAFRSVTVNTAAVMTESNNVHAVSQSEPMYILQQVLPGPAFAKPLAPTVAFPNHQTPIILVLGNPVGPSGPISTGHVPQVSLLGGSQQFAIKNQLQELTLANQGISGSSPVVVAQATPTVMPSGAVLLGNKSGSGQTFSLSIGGQVPQQFAVSNQMSNPTASVSASVCRTPTAISFSSPIQSSSGSSAACKYAIHDEGLRTLTNVRPVSAVEAGTHGLQSLPGITLRPLQLSLSSGQLGERLHLCNQPSTETPQTVSFLNQVQSCGIRQPKSNVGTTPVILTPCQLPAPSLVTNQLQQLVVPISGANSQTASTAPKNPRIQIPLIGHQPAEPTLLSVGDLAGKFGSDMIFGMRQQGSTQVEQINALYAPSTSRSVILPSPVKEGSASTPLLLIQTPTLKVDASPPKTVTSLSAGLPASVASSSGSKVVGAPCRLPFLLQVLPDIARVSDSNVVINMMPVNGSVDLIGGGDDLQNHVQCSAPCLASASPKSSTGTSDNKTLTKTTQVLNGGSRVKMITIKKLMSLPASTMNHSIPVASQVQSQIGSRIKTLLSVQEPQEQVVLLAPGNHDIPTPTFIIGKNATAIESGTTLPNNKLRQNSNRVCVRCGALFAENGREEASNSSNVCIACQLFA